MLVRTHLNYLCYGIEYNICVAHLFTMIMKAENIGINSTKNEKRLEINKNSGNYKKEYRDCIKRKWKQDWDMNATLIPNVVLCLAYQRERTAYQNLSSNPYIVVQ